jgi:hypothetical protein
VHYQDIMRSGRWHAEQNLSLSLPYLGSVSVNVGLVLAGFSKDQDMHILGRGCLLPPEDLQRQIFPWVEMVHKVKQSP